MQRDTSPSKWDYYFRGNLNYLAAEEYDKNNYIIYWSNPHTLLVIYRNLYADRTWLYIPFVYKEQEFVIEKLEL